MSALTEELRAKAAEVDRLQKKSQDDRESLMARIREYEERSSEMEARIAELQKNAPPSGKTMYDSDDMGLLVVENESLKRKVKMLEIKLSDQPSAEKVAQKLEAKDFEVRNLKTKLEKADMDLVR